MINASELNDLASVDMIFAEMLVESGVNPIPTVCDGCDMSILEKDRKDVAQAFVNAETNLQKLIDSLDQSMTMDNKDALGMIIGNLRQKQELIAKSKGEFKDPNFNFMQLYTDLKKVQNQLGINLNFPEMNVLSMTEESFDVEQTKQKVINSAKQLDGILKEGAKNFMEFLKEEQAQEQTAVAEKVQEKVASKQTQKEISAQKEVVKEKVREQKRKKELERENEIRLANMFNNNGPTMSR